MSDPALSFEPLPGEHHVFAWIAGYGWTLTPHAPYLFQRVDGAPRSVRVRHFTPDGPLEAVISIRADGEAEWELGPRTERLEQVVELSRASASGDHWRVAGAPLSFRWPEGFALRSLPGLAPPVFDLAGPDEALVWVQGPLPEANVPPLERMLGPGQRLVRVMESAGGPLAELTYEHEGASWRQFHCVVNPNPSRGRPSLVSRLLRRETQRYVCVVTGQCPEARAETTRQAVVEVAASLTPDPANRA